MIEAVECRSLTNQSEPCQTPAGGESLGRIAPLSRGAIHEWFGVADAVDGTARIDTSTSRSVRRWLPPLCALIHAARMVLAGDSGGSGRVLWIGRRCWPYPRALIGAEDVGGRLLNQSLFVDPVNHSERVWAIDLALRCPAVVAVIADGSRLSMAESRRLQLAASAGSALGLIARPSWELNELSAARTRWLVTNAPSTEASPRWTVELLRCKGLRPVPEDARRMMVRRDHETGVVSLDADVPDRPAASAGTERARRTA